MVEEPETAALRTWLRRRRGALITSDVSRTELVRAVRRAAPDRAELAVALLDALTVVTVDSATFDRAGWIEPSSLRSLDAIHIASALVVGDELSGVVVYDQRLADAARSLGIPTIAPS